MTEEWFRLRRAKSGSAMHGAGKGTHHCRRRSKGGRVDHGSIHRLPPLGIVSDVDRLANRELIDVVRGGAGDHRTNAGHANTVQGAFLQSMRCWRTIANFDVGLGAWPPGMRARQGLGSPAQRSGRCLSVCGPSLEIYRVRRPHRVGADRCHRCNYTITAARTVSPCLLTRRLTQ